MVKINKSSVMAYPGDGCDIGRSKNWNVANFLPKDPQSLCPNLWMSILNFCVFARLSYLFTEQLMILVQVSLPSCRMMLYHSVVCSTREYWNIINWSSLWYIPSMFVVVIILKNWAKCLCASSIMPLLKMLFFNKLPYGRGTWPSLAPWPQGISLRK